MSIPGLPSARHNGIQELLGLLVAAEDRVELSEVVQRAALAFRVVRRPEGGRRFLIGRRGLFIPAQCLQGGADVPQVERFTIMVAGLPLDSERIAVGLQGLRRTPRVLVGVAHAVQ